MQQRNHSLDGLRGYAAAAVVVFHTVLATDAQIVARVVGPPIQSMGSFPDLGAKVVLSLCDGAAAVTLFFVLSGLVLFESLKHDSRISAFIVRRTFRILPALAVAVPLGAGALWLVGRPPSLTQIAADILLLDTGIIGPAWTLQVEAIAVPFILVNFAAFRRFGVAGIGLTFSAAFLLVKAPVPALQIAKPYVLPFALGFLVASPLGAAVARRLTWPLCVAALSVVLLVRQVVPSVNLSTLSMQVGAALLVCGLYYGRAGRLGEALAVPASRFLGRISYSLYLLNVPLLTIAGLWLAGSDPLSVGLPAGLAIVVATVPLAWACERWIERPMIKAGHHVAERWRGRAATGHEPAITAP